jgi:uncharacterized phiE125 gp8 family phage protein
MTPILLSGPVVEPVTLAQMRLHLRLTTTDEDESIGRMITAARLMVEAQSRRLLLEQSWRLVLHQWPQDKAIKLPLAPIMTIDAIRIFNAADQPALLPQNQIVLDRSGPGVNLILTGTLPQPGRDWSGIEIDLKAGYGSVPDAVPMLLRHAVQMYASYLFENRGDAETSLPADIAALIAPYRIMRLT